MLRLEERLRQRSIETGTSLDRLRKEVALQRLLARMAASTNADGWVLKGAQVLLVRLDEKARATKDVDTTWRYEADALRDALDDATEIDLLLRRIARCSVSSRHVEKSGRRCGFRSRCKRH